jgi:HAD superfamily hydrolase (TIGR01459 family)
MPIFRNDDVTQVAMKKEEISTPSGISAIAGEYDAYILDLWGVVHDGVVMYPSAGETLRELTAAGKRIVFLSNAPRRASVVEAVLTKFGIPRESYEAIYSSGEVAHQWLASGQSSFGGKCVFVGLEQDLPVLDGLPLERVENPAEASFVFCAGYDALFQDPSELEPRLSAWATAQLPMLCINPDITVVRQDGSTIYCAGHLARRYEELGGQVTYIGKPYPIVYEAIAAHFAADAPRACNALPVARTRMLAVGDSLHTDILGANQAGIASALITGGIHSHDIAAGMSLEQLMERDHATPNYVLPAFAW